MAYSLSGLMKWCQRAEWREPFNETLVQHLGEVCAEAGIAFEELPAIIGDHFGVLWGCAFEDFLTLDGKDDSNIVDDYLKRRGWNESVSNKRYMTALRSSVMSLYEISDIVRDEGFLARDLIRGGEPVRVGEKSGTHTLKPWDRIAVRVVETGSRFEMTGGCLPFTHDLSEELLEAFRLTSKKTHVPLDTETLRRAAPLFTSLWLWVRSLRRQSADAKLIAMGCQHFLGRARQYLCTGIPQAYLVCVDYVKSGAADKCLAPNQPMYPPK